MSAVGVAAILTSVAEGQLVDVVVVVAGAADAAAAAIDDVVVVHSDADRADYCQSPLEILKVSGEVVVAVAVDFVVVAVAAGVIAVVGVVGDVCVGFGAEAGVTVSS